MTTLPSRVLVTGASGFVACHIVKQLLCGEEYVVRGTVRSLANETKCKPLKNLVPNAKYPLELVEADLLNKECWASAVKDCEYVLHVASPFPASNPSDEMEVIQPAVDGTKNVLEACAATRGAVKRVVLTSSIVSIYAGHLDEQRVLTEEDWSVEEKCNPYEKSKTLAEKAAWEYVGSLSDDEKFELVVINPGLVFGPILQGSSCTSMELPRRLLQREMPMIPDLQYALVDVRDAARAHIKAMTLPQAPGKRYIAVNGGQTLKDMALILKEEFRPQGYCVPTTVCPKIVLQVASWFDTTIKMILPSVGKEMHFKTDKYQNELGIEPINLSNTLVDMAYSMIDGGFVKKTTKYKGRPGTSA